jgi:hypothetical protein
VFNFDERIRGLPAKRDQVVALYQSVNSPHLAIPGKKAGVAQAYVVVLRGPSGFGIFIYLYLSEASDCAVYLYDRRSLSLDEYPGVEQEAMGFVESMGFMMGNLNFRSVPLEQQEEMIRTLPVFQKEPRAPAAAASAAAEAVQAPTAASIGKLFTAF